LKPSIQHGALIVVTTLLAILAAQSVFAANDEAEIRAAVKRFDAAFNSHNTRDFLALYTPDGDSIYFEEVVPLQIKGRDAFRKYVDLIFTQTSQLLQKTTVEGIIADRNVAAAACIVRASWTDTSGQHSQVGRFTMVLKKLDGKWLIWHEHYSLPCDDTTGKAVFDATPWELRAGSHYRRKLRAHRYDTFDLGRDREVVTSCSARSATKTIGARTAMVGASSAGDRTLRRNFPTGVALEKWEHQKGRTYYKS
jgi:uncharacterized protein (TIGR02246 family)